MSGRVRKRVKLRVRVKVRKKGKDGQMEWVEVEGDEKTIKEEKRNSALEQLRFQRFYDNVVILPNLPTKPAPKPATDALMKIRLVRDAGLAKSGDSHMKRKATGRRHDSGRRSNHSTKSEEDCTMPGSAKSSKSDSDYDALAQYDSYLGFKVLKPSGKSAVDDIILRQDHRQGGQMALGGGMLPDNVGSESSPARSWSGKHKSRAEQNQLREMLDAGHSCYSEQDEEGYNTFVQLVDDINNTYKQFGDYWITEDTGVTETSATPINPTLPPHLLDRFGQKQTYDIPNPTTASSSYIEESDTGELGTAFCSEQEVFSKISADKKKTKQNKARTGSVTKPESKKLEGKQVLEGQVLEKKHHKRGKAPPGGDVGFDIRGSEATIDSLTGAAEDKSGAHVHFGVLNIRKMQDSNASLKSELRDTTIPIPPSESMITPSEPPGKHIGYDRDGNPIHEDNIGNASIFINGKSHPIPKSMYDPKTGNLYLYDNQGNPLNSNDGLVGFDARGNKIYEDSDGKRFRLKNNGTRMPVTRSSFDNETGKMVLYDEEGRRVSDPGRIVGYDKMGNKIFRDDKGRQFLISDQGRLPVTEPKLIIYDQTGKQISEPGRFIGFDEMKNQIFQDDSGNKFLLAPDGTQSAMKDEQTTKSSTQGRSESDSDYDSSYYSSSPQIAASLGKDKHGNRIVQNKANDKFLSQKDGSKVPLDANNEPMAVLGNDRSGNPMYGDKNGNKYMITASLEKLPLDNQGAVMKRVGSDHTGHSIFQDKNGNQFMEMNGQRILLDPNGEPMASLGLDKLGNQLFQDQYGNKLLLTPENELTPAEYNGSPMKSLMRDALGNRWYEDSKGNRYKFSSKGLSKPLPAGLEPVDTDKSGQQVYQDSNGNRFVIDEAGNKLLLDKKGVPMNYYSTDTNGNQIFADQKGNRFMVGADGTVTPLDPRGNPIPHDNEGNLMKVTGQDANGNTIYADKNGTQFVLDSKGNKIPVDGYGDAMSIIGSDQRGNMIFQDKRGNKLMLTPDGQILPLDQDGQPMRVIGEDDYGNKIYEDSHGNQFIVDSKGNKLLMDKNGDPMSFLGTDENGKSLYQDKYGNKFMLTLGGDVLPVDKDGNPLKLCSKDEYGNQIYEDRQGNQLLLDKNGEAMNFLGTDKNGNNIYQDAAGNKFMLTQDGEVVPIDKNGHPMKFLGHDNEGNAMYEDSNGQRYTLSEDGELEPVREEDTTSQSAVSSLQPIGKDNKGNTVYQDKGGNKFIIDSDGNECLLDYNGSGMKLVGIDSQGNKIFQDNKGNKFILTPEGDVIPADDSGNKMKLVSEDSHGKKLFQDQSGNKFLLTADGKLLPVDSKGNPYPVDGNGNRMDVVGKAIDGKLIFADTKGNNFILDGNGNKLLLDGDGEPMKYLGLDDRRNMLYMDKFGNKYLLGKDDEINPLDAKGEPMKFMGEDMSGSRLFEDRYGDNYRLTSDNNLLPVNAQGDERPLCPEGSKPLGADPVGNKFFEDPHGNIFIISKDGKKILLSESDFEITDDSASESLSLSGGARQQLGDSQLLGIDPEGNCLYEDKKGNKFVVDKNGKTLQLMRYDEMEEEQEQVGGLHVPGAGLDQTKGSKFSAAQKYKMKSSDRKGSEASSAKSSEDGQPGDDGADDNSVANTGGGRKMSTYSEYTDYDSMYSAADGFGFTTKTPTGSKAKGHQKFKMEDKKKSKAQEPILLEVMSMDDDADIALMLGADPQHADDKLAEKIQKYKMLSNKLDDPSLNKKELKKVNKEFEKLEKEFEKMYKKAQKERRKSGAVLDIPMLNSIYGSPPDTSSKSGWSRAPTLTPAEPDDDYGGMVSGMDRRKSSATKKAMKNVRSRSLVS